MDIVLTSISVIVSMICLLYILKEMIRRKQSTYLETYFNIKVSIIFYAITTPIILIFHFAYYLNAYPSSSPTAVVIVSIVLLIFPFISYVLAKKKIIIYDDKVIVQKIFHRIEVNLKDINEISHHVLMTRVYANKKLLVSIDRRRYDHIRKFIEKIEESINYIDEQLIDKR